MTIRRQVRQSAAVLSNRILLAFLILAGLTWTFFSLADAVFENETDTFDTLVVLAFRNPADLSDPFGPIWVEEMARDITGLGGLAVLSLLVIVSAGFLWLRAQRRLAVVLISAVATGTALSQFLKFGFDRARPDLVSQEAAVYTASFPSGHSMMAAIVYLTLAVLLARTLHGKVAKAYVIAVATLVVIAVGISRVYLGVHWPTDVLAGWIIGAAWALLFGIVAKWLTRDDRLATDMAD
ncbi:phosphatase PAP2 family protein [Gymnodinialimonas sp. 57CJ19]|uniref:phosphatase PAP2 family protein n=1 Tax=Gymnodinialimonas sp. 57CJ19 TaxID=3138498 RepID=UPI0031343111